MVNKLKRALVILLLVTLFPLFANLDETKQLLLLYNDIVTSSDYELIQRSKSLALPTNKSSDELVEQLLSYYSIEKTEMESTNILTEQKDNFEIAYANQLFIEGRFIILDGDVDLIINSTNSENKFHLQADKIVVDVDNKIVSALGDLSYTKTAQDKEDFFDGEILTLNWDDLSLLLKDGSTKMVRTISDKEEFEFYLLGSSLSFTKGNKGILIEDGIVTTNKEQAYFSLKAKSLFLVDGGDIFAKRATLSLGRVPILWLPFFYYPAKIFVFNPAVGFDLERGWFANTTTELYGTYPKIDRQQTNEGLSSILNFSRDETLYKDGWTYSTSPTASDSWAHRSDSYMALLFDTYQNSGVFVALDSQNNFFDKKLQLTNFSSIAFDNNLEKPLRYGFNLGGKLDTPNLKFSFKGDYYSDVKYKRDYLNRLTAFSVSHLIDDPVWPDSYLSEVHSLNWLFSIEGSVPKKYLPFFISTLRLERLNGQIEWISQNQVDEKPFIIKKVILPDLRASISGTIFSFKQKQKVVEQPIKATTNWPVKDFYTASAKVSPTAASIQLNYSASQIYNESKELVTNRFDNYGRTLATFTLRGNSTNNWIKLDQSIENSYTTNASLTVDKQSYILKNRTALSSTPLGITYTLNNQIYSLVKDQGIEEIKTGWDDNLVTRHDIGIKYPINAGQVVITPSFSSTLDPIPLKLLPSLTVSWRTLSFGSSYSIIEDDNKKLKGDELKLNFTYNDSKIANLELELGYKEGSLSKFKESFSLNIIKDYFKFSNSLTYDFTKESFENVDFKGSTNWASMALYASGPKDDFKLNQLDTKVFIDSFKLSWWKERITFSLNLEGGYNHSFIDNYASNLNFKIATTFSIAEFLDLSFSVKSVNRGFYRYDSFKDVFDDFIKSFDFSGDGRRSTQFNMEEIEIGLVHYMADWDLHCKYHSAVVLSDSQYHWRPTFTIYLQWKAFEQIKIDKKYELNN